MVIWGIILPFFFTVFGSFLILLLKTDMNPKLNVIFVALASGIMASASFFSLLIPSMDYCIKMNYPSWLVVSGSFLLGALIIQLIDCLFKENEISQFLFAVILHNIPEGLAVGLVFGISVELGCVMSAFSFALGIGIQNLPEGTAVSLTWLKKGKGKKQAFWVGVLSGAIEPVFGLLGYFLAKNVMPMMPFALAFSAWAMIYVIILEMVNEFTKPKIKTMGSLFFLLGFIIMMILDLAFS